MTIQKTACSVAPRVAAAMAFVVLRAAYSSFYHVLLLTEVGDQRLAQGPENDHVADAAETVYPYETGSWNGRK